MCNIQLFKVEFSGGGGHTPKMEYEMSIGEKNTCPVKFL